MALTHSTQLHSSLTEQVAIGLYGFVIAATWIDWIAGQLVFLLQSLGVILRIPNYIMGLTVLAWGNSMADLSAVSPSILHHLLDSILVFNLSPYLDYAIISSLLSFRTLPWRERVLPIWQSPHASPDRCSIF